MHLYESTYKSLHFERAGLFKTVQEKYHGKDVLYPGSSVHVTPSLYFPHVVYVDQSEATAQFFASERPIAEFVSRNKHYEQSAYIRFVRQDYSQPLPLREESFDLLLALFAGGIANPCYRYLKIGGFLLTNNHQGDAADALQHADLQLAAKIVFQRQAYAISEDAREQEISRQKFSTKYVRQADQGIAYVEYETYYLFRRTR
jgi:hypothetical protein